MYEIKICKKKKTIAFFLFCIVFQALKDQKQLLRELNTELIENYEQQLDAQKVNYEQQLDAQKVNYEQKITNVIKHF